MSILLGPMTALPLQRRSFIIFTMLIIIMLIITVLIITMYVDHHHRDLSLFTQVAMNMDFDSGWGDDEDGGDSWGDDGDDEDWKRKKREAVKVKKEKKKVEEENKRIRREVETALFPKEENKRIRREVEEVEMSEEENKRMRREVEEVEMSEEENKRMRREAAAKWRKGTQVWHFPVLSMYFNHIFVSVSYIIYHIFVSLVSNI